MRHDPNPSTSLGASKLAGWGILSASYLATEERHLAARTLAAHTRLLRENAPPESPAPPSLVQRMVAACHSAIFRRGAKSASISGDAA